jgi:hypothetical protein
LHRRLAAPTQPRAEHPRNSHQLIADSSHHGDTEGHGGSALNRSIGTEDMVAAQAAEQAVGLHDEALAVAKEAGLSNVETIVARGKGWDGALRGITWAAGDVLVFGSSRLG